MVQRGNGYNEVAVSNQNEPSKVSHLHTNTLSLHCLRDTCFILFIYLIDVLNPK
jgi:hypothetical protein